MKRAANHCGPNVMLPLNKKPTPSVLNCMSF